MNLVCRTRTRLRNSRLSIPKGPSPIPVLTPAPVQSEADIQRLEQTPLAQAVDLGDVVAVMLVPRLIKLLSRRPIDAQD